LEAWVAKLYRPVCQLVATPYYFSFFANSAGSIATSTSFDCAAFSVVPIYGFLNNAGPVPWHMHRAVSGFHFICMVLYSEKTFSPVFGPSSGAERLNAKKIWDEDDDATLEEIGVGEKVLIDHDEEAW
jgi:hypothetical protein